MSQLTINKFIEKANKVHKNFYDYSIANYTQSKFKIKIICKEHGVFEQRANSHLLGNGCPVCGRNKTKLTQKEFIDKANIVHNYLYNYSEVNYTFCKNKVKIICPKHGVFEQTPDNHLTGNGCFVCKSDKFKLTQEEFIDKANIVHNYLYNYSEVNYIFCKNKVKIICPKHGVFEQLPYNHIRGQGCPKCSESKGEKTIREYLQLNHLKFKQEYIYKNFRFDFLVIKDSLPMIIEFNGIQHYRPVNFGSKKEKAAETGLIYNVKRDFAKYKKCKENHVSLLVIPYWDIKRIPEILDDFFKGNEPTYSQPPKVVIEYKKYWQASHLILGGYFD